MYVITSIMVGLPVLLYIAAILKIEKAVKGRRYPLLLIPTFNFFVASAWLANMVLQLPTPESLISLFHEFKLIAGAIFIVLIAGNEIPFLFVNNASTPKDVLNEIPK